MADEVNTPPKEPQPLTPDDLKPGEWVLVRGRAVEQDSPFEEEARIMFRSHNEDYVALVHQDFLHSIVPAPPSWPQCPGALAIVAKVNGADAEVLARCVSSHGHPGKHRSRIQGVEPWSSNDPKHVYVEED